MIFRETEVAGAFIIDIERKHDERGFFARTWCQKEFEAHGLTARLCQLSISSNQRKGTIRGLHFQRPPHEEAKAVRCIRGSIFDVVVDLRRESPTYLRWAAAELTADNQRMLYVPEGCAHGLQTLTDDVEVLYLISEFYVPDHAEGARYNDAAFGIDWPLPVSMISERDQSWPNYQR